MRRVVFVVALLSCTGGRPTVDDSEPAGECAVDGDCAGYELCTEGLVCAEGDRDNAYTEATPIFLVDDLEGDPSASGFIAPAGDVDYYALTSAGSEWIEIRTRPPGEFSDVDTVVTVRDASGGLHAWMDDYATGAINGWDSVLQAYLPTAGTWYVTVEDVTSFADAEEQVGGPSFDYDLYVRRYSGGIADPDASTDPGREIDVEDGFIYSAGILLRDPGDSDWIQVTMPHADAPIEVWGQPDIPGSPAVPRVRIHGPADELLAQKDGVGPEGIADYPLAGAATYLIEATDAAGAGGAGHWYTLYVRTRDAGTTGQTEIEPNDTLATAQPLSLVALTTSGGSVYDRGWAKGTLLADGDEDWFAFSAVADRYLSVRCTSTDYGSLGAFTLDLHGPDEALVTSAADGDDDYDITNHPVGAAAGTWRLRISAAGGTPTYGPGSFYNCIVFLTTFEAS